MIAILDTQTISQTAPIHLSFHLAVTLNITAEDARRRVNRHIVAELGTGLIARDPNLVVDDDKVFWRVPIALSLPTLGDLGLVGSVDVDAQTGDLLLSSEAQAAMIQHAERLYAGATLPAE